MPPRTSDLKQIRRALLRWYARNHRRLPWRQTRDPYRILVSEYLLQQTRVDQALPFYRRFVGRFPTLRRLAGAPLSAVLKVWQGLGYYGRARSLHRAARELLGRSDGQIPRSLAALQKLPGCGTYTSAAVASIAFGVPEPVLDGNVSRLLSRFCGVRGVPGRSAILRELRMHAGLLISRGRPGVLNQAMMELGATICTPKNPQCGRCCWSRWCIAFREGLTNELPLRRPRRAVPVRDIAIGIIWHRNRILIARRRPESLLGGLWEFPGGKRKGRETLRNCCAREILEEVGLKVQVLHKISVLRYAYTHFKVRLHVFRCAASSDQARAIGCDRVVWEYPHRLSRYAFPTATKRLIEGLSSGSLSPHVSTDQSLLVRGRRIG